MWCLLWKDSSLILRFWGGLCLHSLFHELRGVSYCQIRQRLSLASRVMRSTCHQFYSTLMDVYLGCIYSGGRGWHLPPLFLTLCHLNCHPTLHLPLFGKLHEGNSNVWVYVYAARNNTPKRSWRHCYSRFKPSPKQKLLFATWLTSCSNIFGAAKG